MARLIDADALSLPMIGDGDMQGRYTATMGCRGQGRVLAVAHELYLRMIADAPTVDAVPVVHGRWIKTYTCGGEWLWGYDCDQCKADSPRRSNYCPNCGANMDLEEVEA